MASPVKTRSPKRSISSRTPTKRSAPDKKIPRQDNLIPPTGSELDPKLQDVLCSKEILRASPELWPEKIPGVGEFATQYGTSPVLSKSEAAASSLDSALEKDDHEMLQEFGSLTTSQLMDKVKALQNLAYQLGVEEAREMTRGKFLNILGKSEFRR